MTKKDIAYELIKNKIVNHEINTGEIISENTMVKELNMSRTPIRGALQLLESQGFIKILQGVGGIVSDMTVKEAIEINDLRIALETFVIKNIINEINDTDIQNLSSILSDQETALAKNDFNLAMEKDMKFHSYLWNKLENEKILTILTNSRERIKLSGYKALTKAGRQATTLKEHRELLRALETRDILAALEAMETHLKNGKLHLLQNI